MEKMKTIWGESRNPWEQNGRKNLEMGIDMAHGNHMLRKKKQGREEMDCGSHVGSEYLKRKPIILTKDVIQISNACLFGAEFYNDHNDLRFEQKEGI